MNFIIRNNKIKRFIKLIESLDEIMIYSKLWNFTRTGLGEIGQGNLFYIQNSLCGFKEINFLKLIKVILTFSSVIIFFPVKFLFYKLRRFLNIKSFVDYFKTNQTLKIFLAPVDIKNNLIGSHQKIFINLQNKYNNLILIPLKPFTFKNIFSLSESNNKIINLSDIFMENPYIFFSWIKEIFYIFITLLKTNKKNLDGINRFVIILSFIECSLRQSYETYALINLIKYRLNKININFYSTFEANTFEKVLVNFRSNESYYEAFNVCALTEYLTKHIFYYRLIKNNGFPNKIYTPESKFYNSTILKNYSSISKRIVRVKNTDKTEIRKVDHFKFKFALLCAGGFDPNYLLDFVRKLIIYKICHKNEIIVSLHPAAAITNYSLKLIQKLGLETTINLNKSISNSQIGIYVSSSSSINAIDCNMPLIKVNSGNILDCNNALDVFKGKNDNILKLDIELKNKDLITLKKFLLNKKIQYRKSSNGWYYG